MNVVMRQSWTLEQFLAWEERQELRWEFDGDAPVAMNGGTMNHDIIGGTLRALLRDQLKGTKCRAFGPTLKIQVAGRIRYPDAFISCVSAPGDQTIAPDPVAVFEVLSPSTSSLDRIVKLREYQATASILYYVILEQDSVAATLFARRGEHWVATAQLADDRLDLPDIGIQLSLADIYADAEMAPQR